MAYSIIAVLVLLSGLALVEFWLAPIREDFPD